MHSDSYSDSIDKKNELKIRELLNDLPMFCREFFRGIEPVTQSRTRLGYAFDLRIFFHYMQDNNPSLAKIPMHDLPIEILKKVTATDIEEYLSYLKVYENESGTEYTNDERGIMRKLSSLRTFFHYFYQKEVIEKDPSVLVSMPKIHQKNIIRLDPDEVAILLDQVENGEGLTDRQKVYHEKTKERDFAMLTLLLGTGIRVSECVGLDISDVDFKNGGVRVIRKGGAEQIVYFGKEVNDALSSYMDKREHITAAKGHEDALFLSMQNKRISVRAVENLVKKYAGTVTSLKKITPHKLRSTYGTSLYRVTFTWWQMSWATRT